MKHKPHEGSWGQTNPFRNLDLTPIQRRAVQRRDGLPRLSAGSENQRFRALGFLCLGAAPKTTAAGRRILGGGILNTSLAKSAGNHGRSIRSVLSWPSL